MTQLRERLLSLFRPGGRGQKEGGLPDEILQRGFQQMRSVDPETEQQWLRLQRVLAQRGSEIAAAKPLPIRRFALGFAVVALATVGVYLYSTFFSPSPETFATGKGEQMQVVLNDGSHVTLNYATEVAVSKLRQNEPRLVSLEGEAYFRVQHGETPFVVSTRYAQVRVVGTEFNLRAREGTLEVAVVNGTVNVSVVKEGKDSTLQLTQNQRAVCPQNDFPARIGNIPSPEYPGWMHGKLFLDRTSFLAACREIEMRFDVVVRVSDPRLPSEIITGILDAKTAHSAVTALCELTGKKFTHDGQEFHLY